MKIIDFLEKYFTKEENFFIFSLDRKNKKGFQKSFTLNDNGLIKYLNKMEWFNKNGCDIYYSLNTFKPIEKKIKRREENIENIKSFYFDIDKDTEIIYPKIIEYFGTPTFDINTSPNKKQLIYQFEKPFKGDTKYFSQLLQGCCYQFETDKTFDTPRIFKLCGGDLINNKNGYKINFEYSEKYFKFEDFEKLSKPFLPLTIKEVKTPSKNSKMVSNIKKDKRVDTNFTEYEKYKGMYKINKKYNELLKRCDNDYSKTDISFVKWLRTSKQISNEEILIEKLFLSRGYESLMEKHGYQIDYYLENILEKTINPCS